MIAVIGESDASAENIEIAKETGSLIAEREGILICGGLSGVMSAAAEGAQKAGGITIGVLSNYDRNSANEYIDLVIPTGMGHARNAIIVASAHGVIAIGGHYGTLSEIALARKLGKPVMTISSFEIHREGKVQGDILSADTPRHAVSRLFKLLESPDEWTPSQTSTYKGELGK
ncbi:TIGR00725 family protein [bacterium]|nr:TIGR00725 family protein [bacterium]MBU1025728.1 TIGR00725 family protein [bacterium]